MPRSGTTLLLSMLNSVETNLCIPEIPIAMYLFNSHRNRTVFNENDFRKILSLRTKLKYIRNVNIKENFFVDNLNDCKTYQDFIQLACLSISDDSKKIQLIENIIDKNPIYTFYTDELSSIFPESKFIIMTRNPFGFVNSCIESIDPGKKARSAEFYSFAYEAYAKQIIRLQKKYFDRSLIIRYEDFVEKPEFTLNLICNFLEFEFNSDMLEFYKKSQNSNVKKEIFNESQKIRMEYKFEALAKPVNTTRIESWKNKLTPKEIQIIRSVTQSTAQKLGYEIEYSPLQFSFNYLKSKLIVRLYFNFAKYFYLLPIRFREIFRVKV